MELQEKQHNKDYRKQKICLERTYSGKMSVNSGLKATKIIGQRKAFYSTSKALAIPSDATVRRSAVEQEDLKPYWK